MRVLVVEDEPHLLTQSRVCCAGNGMATDCVHGGDTALDRLASSAKSIRPYTGSFIPRWFARS